MEDEEADAVERALTTYSGRRWNTSNVAHEIQDAKKANFVEHAFMDWSTVADAKWKLKRQRPLGVGR